MLAPLAGTRGLSSSAAISSRDVGRSEPGTELGIGPAQHLGVHGAGAEADRADAVRPALHRDRLGEPDHPVLGHVVGRQPRELLGRVHARERGDVDDPSFARGAHGAERRAAAEERAGQVHGEGLLPQLGGRLLERRRGQHRRPRTRARPAGRSARRRRTARRRPRAGLRRSAPRGRRRRGPGSLRPRPRARRRCGPPARRGRRRPPAPPPWRRRSRGSRR